MNDHRDSAADYAPEQLERARATCLYLATRLGDLADDLVVVGGLVPSLLVDSVDLPVSGTPHVGTLDVDLGMTLAVVNEGRYRTLAEALRQSGFEPDVNASGRRTRQRWRLAEASGVTVDFLVEPPAADARGGDLLDLEADFAAIITPGLAHAFHDREVKELKGETIFGGRASRNVGVCGPGAFVLLKALAFGKRGKEKDAYDLVWMLQSYGRGVEDVVERFAALREDGHLRAARDILLRDFTGQDATGPLGVARFLTGDRDDRIQADAVGIVMRFLEEEGKRRQ